MENLNQNRKLYVTITKKEKKNCHQLSSLWDCQPHSSLEEHVEASLDENKKATEVNVLICTNWNVTFYLP